MTYSKGKYSVGTFAHSDIALEFASWIDNLFKLYLIKEFKRLKYNESYQEKLNGLLEEVYLRQIIKYILIALKKILFQNLQKSRNNLFVLVKPML